MAYRKKASCNLLIRGEKLEFKHKPVLLEETINGLNIKKDGIYVDGTLGGGGHSKEILKHLSKEDSALYSKNPSIFKLHYSYRKFNISLPEIQKDFKNFLRVHMSCIPMRTCCPLSCDWAPLKQA